MLKKILFIILFSLSIAFALSPAKPGIIPSQKVKHYSTIMAADYSQGGLVAKMQRVKTANIRSAENGDRDFREDVYMSFPVIMGSYADHEDLDTARSMLQQELFDGPWPSPTMTEHYEEMSYDQFHLSGAVYGWYELDSSSYFYEGSQSEPYDNGFNGPPGGVGEFLRDALDLADLEIDFSQYDNDGPDGIANSGDDDGAVDAAFFVHSGRGGEGGGPYIWSHRWVYSGWWGSAYLTNDTGIDGTPIRVNDYIMQPAVSTNGGLIEIGVFSHEFGHALGLPDLYDTDYSSNGIGSWCLMASGSWSTPSSPVHMSAWCKEMLGWTIPIVPDENMDVIEFLNAEENAFVLKLWTHGDLDPFVGSYSHGEDVGREYFLIENRQHIGTEQHLPGTGLLIWHIDNSQWGNNDENHRMVDVEAADGVFNGSSPGDPWPGTTNNRNFDFETIPSAVNWAGNNTEVAVLNISDSDSMMTADIEVHEVNPHISIVDMIISDTNGDNIFSPGEDVQIWLTVKNTGGSAENLTASMSVDSVPVDIFENLIDFNTIGFMETETSNLPFEFDISDTLTPQIATFDISFLSDEILEADHHELTLMLGTPEVAVIDDDGVVSGAGDYQVYYKDAMQIAGIVCTVWDVADHGLPDLDWLQNSSKVLWFTGDNTSPLDDARLTLLSDYLGNGGHAILSGQDISNGNIAVDNFLGEYFSAQVSAENVSSVYVYGDTEHEMMEATDHYSISNSNAAHNQSTQDAFTVLDGGASLFIYPFTGDLSCGVSVKNITYSGILLGFGLEALGGFTGDSDSVRASLLGRMFTWLDLDLTATDGLSKIPGTFGIISAYPNPFNPSITIDYELSAVSYVSIIIYDTRGRKVRTLYRSQQLAGKYSVSWDGTTDDNHQMSTGIYFARIMSGNSSDVAKIVYLR